MNHAETKRMLAESLALFAVTAALLALPYWCLPAQPPTHNQPTPHAAIGGDEVGTPRPGCAGGPNLNRKEELVWTLKSKN